MHQVLDADRGGQQRVLAATGPRDGFPPTDPMPLLRWLLTGRPEGRARTSWPSMRCIFQIALGVAVVSPAAFGADTLSGRNAAYIDWAVKYCGAESTDKEHSLIDQAYAKGKDEFIAQYTEQSNKLSPAAGSPEMQEKMCSEIKEWYGPLGSRSADLLRWKQDARSDSGTKSTAAPSDKRKGKRPSASW
jgi:hypothetical protein